MTKCQAACAPYDSPKKDHELSGSAEVIQEENEAFMRHLGPGGVPWPDENGGEGDVGVVGWRKISGSLEVPLTPSTWALPVIHGPWLCTVLAQLGVGSRLWSRGQLPRHWASRQSRISPWAPDPWPRARGGGAGGRGGAQSHRRNAGTLCGFALSGLSRFAHPPRLSRNPCPKRSSNCTAGQKCRELEAAGFSTLLNPQHRLRSPSDCKRSYTEEGKPWPHPPHRSSFKFQVSSIIVTCVGRNPVLNEWSPAHLAANGPP